VNYTLYIDESGDFETQRGQWVLAGILFSETYENCEHHLIKHFKSMPSKLNIRSIKNFHLTEFRKIFGHNDAVEMAEKVLNQLNSLPFNYHCLATINIEKHSLSNREKTYRLMLSDLLMLCETTIPENEVITNLDLVVASRTIEGELQTSISQIDNEIIKKLPLALEVDLATKGMVELIGKHIKIKMDYANKSWGLVCADFLANINYSNHEKNEKKLLSRLENEGKYSLFESFGGFEIRRANIAERDNDYVLALYRWLIIEYKKIDSEKSKQSIQRLLFKLFNHRGTTGHIISFEAVIERLWRNHKAIDQYPIISEILHSFETNLILFSENNPSQNYQHFLFRLRNLKLVVENHRANTTKALHIVKQQNELLSALASNPEYFQMILNFKATEIEIFVNALDLEKALDLSEKYFQMINNYKEIWALLIEQDDINEFSTSRASIKAEMIRLRCNILYLGINNHTISSNFIDDFNDFEKYLIIRSDISRFNNYKVMLLLKQNSTTEAVQYFLDKFDGDEQLDLSVFDLFWFLKAINQDFFASKKYCTNKIIEIINDQVKKTDLNKKGHPIDLILRELALFEFHLNNKSKAIKYIKKSQRIFDLENSEIADWLSEVTTIHHDYIIGKLKNDDLYFMTLKNNLLIKTVFNSNNKTSLIERARYYSPY
jgi:hypothetical protein